MNQMLLVSTHLQTFIWKERKASLGEGWRPWDGEGEDVAIKLVSCFHHYSMPTPVDVFCVFDWSDSVHFKAVTRVLVT
jgi:hypothetical protein